MTRGTAGELLRDYEKIEARIRQRIAEFKKILKRNSGPELLTELMFCLLTPQSSARRSHAAISSMLEKKILFTGSFEQIRDEIKTAGVRFMNNKARYILEAREQFPGGRGLGEIISGVAAVHEKREIINKRVKGLGLKESSHYLRNIGLGEEIAILDRHILRNMERLGIIEKIPASLNESTYLDYEKRLIRFSKKIKIPADHLDFLLWYRETGDIFK